ncbi:MAG: helix-turn-helix transcriptional regulator [Flavobacteriaceae bacterium]|nr:helix-turn-helix transcriptional regulator [Flavobacteriaceae bacterium]
MVLQSDLAKKVGISYAQIGRYEIKGAQPPAEVLKKIADTLNYTYYIRILIIFYNIYTY